MQIGSALRPVSRSFCTLLIFPHRGGPQQAESSRTGSERNRCKPLLPGRIGGLRPRRIIARLCHGHRASVSASSETLQHDHDAQTLRVCY